MEEIIKINEETHTVSARDLYEKIGTTERFSSWFERQLQFGFEEGVDFTSVKSFTVVNNGAKKEIDDYNLSINMAKEICMVQKTDKSRTVRQYLISIEDAWNSPEQIMARALKVADATIANFKNQIAVMKPKADYFDALVDRNLLTNFRDTAKEIHIKQNTLINLLLTDGYVYREQTHKALRPYAQFVDAGLFELKEFTNSNTQGAQTLITPKGRETFRLLYGRENNLLKEGE